MSDNNKNINSGKQNTQNAPDNTVEKAHEEAEKDIEKDPDFQPDPTADLDEGELARAEGED